MAESTVTERPARTAQPTRNAQPAPELRNAQPAPAREVRAPQAPKRPKDVGNLAYRVLLGIATTLVSVNLWSGGPLLALWVGSRLQAAVGSLSMAAVGATVGVLIVESVLLYQLLAWLSIRYNAAIGRKMKRRQAAWLKPMSGERRTLEVSQPLTAIEKIVVVSVVVAAEAFVVWFFFFSHYSLPG